MKKILIIGYGSIGKRHASLLKDEYTIAILSRRPVNEYLGFSDLQVALKEFSPDHVIIANETSAHLETLRQLDQLQFNGKILIEKPIFHEPSTYQPKHPEHIFVAYNLRFHPIIEKLRELVIKHDLYLANIYVGSYYPNWRTTIDHKQSYSSYKSKGGGVLKDLSHELDYAYWFFGLPTKSYSMLAKLGDVTQDAEDTVNLWLKFNRCPTVSIHLNYLDQIGKREIILVGKDLSIKADLVTNILSINDETQQFQVDRNTTYQKMHKAFLNDTHPNLSTYSDGLAITNLIQELEQKNIY
jgi:predicted dehydrogenase